MPISVKQQRKKATELVGAACAEAAERPWGVLAVVLTAIRLPAPEVQRSLAQKKPRQSDKHGMRCRPDAQAHWRAPRAFDECVGG